MKAYRGVDPPDFLGETGKRIINYRACVKKIVLGKGYSDLIKAYSDLGAHAGEFSSPIPTGTSICRLGRVPVNQEEKGKPFADVVHKHTARRTPIRKP